MRVVQAVGWYFPESIGGTEVYVAALSKRLREAGHDVRIAVPDSTRDREGRYVHDGLPVYRYPVPADPTRSECQGRVIVRGTEHFHRWLSNQRADVVHFHTFVTGLGLAEVLAARSSGARVIATTHAGSLGFICARGTMMQWGESLCDGISEPAKCGACELQRRGLPKPLSRMVGAIPPKVGRLAASLPGNLGTVLGMRDSISRNESLQREMIAAVDRFVLLTKWAFDTVVANGGPPEKLALVRLGLSQDKPAHKSSAQVKPSTAPIKIGYLGRFDAIKGVHDLARAIRALPRTLPFRVEFRGPVRNVTEKAIVKELQAILANDSRVVFADAVPTEDVPQVLAGYDVLCCPSVCLEGGPTVAIEAHAVGTPVIGTAIGGLGEMVTDGLNGRLVTPGDWRALSLVLQEIVLDPHRTVDRWRVKLPQTRTMDHVATDYLLLYNA